MKLSDPFKIIPPNERWAPSQSQMKGKDYEMLLPPLVYKVRMAVARWRDESYHGASETSKSLLNFWFNQEHMVGQLVAPWRKLSSAFSLRNVKP